MPTVAEQRGSIGMSSPRCKFQRAHTNRSLTINGLEMVVAGDILNLYGLYHAVAPFSNYLFLRQKLVSVRYSSHDMPLVTSCAISCKMQRTQPTIHRLNSDFAADYGHGSADTNPLHAMIMCVTYLSPIHTWLVQSAKYLCIGVREEAVHVPKAFAHACEISTGSINPPEP